jgi:NADPH:quinone reductase-like Zn-dependent oxidoreductase
MVPGAKTNARKWMRGRHMEVWELKEAFGPEHLQKGERVEPKPGPNQVLVEMRAASLNYRDTLVIRGGYGPRVKVPLVPVSDGAGVVAAVGEGVGRVRVGDRVAPVLFQSWIGGPPTPEKFHATLGGPLDGVLSRHMCLNEQGISRVPGHLSDEEAACLPCAALTAWSALITQGRIGPGDTVLVQGTGGVALFAMQFAKMAGARVIITSSRDDKLARARQLGADETINYRTTPEWDKATKDLTAGEGCDHVVELGGAGTLERSIRATRIGGTISLIGVLSGAKAEASLPLVVMRNLRLQGVTVGSRDGFEDMCRAIGRHGLKPVVDRVFDFDDVPAAFAHLEGGHHMGKVCIRF